MGHVKISAFCLLLFCIASQRVSAQSRVDQYSITQFQSAWSELEGSTTTVVAYAGGSNSGSYSLALPFDFPYDGVVLPQGTLMAVGANGAISLTNMTVPDRQALSDVAYPMLIGPFNGDIKQGSDASAHLADTLGLYQISGAAPNRVLTIEYPAFHLRGGGGGGKVDTLTGMQVKLYETSGIIEFIYRDHGLEMPTRFPNVSVAIGLSGAATPTFVSKIYASDTKLIPAKDLRWTPAVSSVHGSDEEVFSLYPNPCTNMLQLVLPLGGEIRQIRASDVRGNVYLLDHANDQINVTSLAAGSYRVTIETDTDSHTEWISVIR